MVICAICNMDFIQFHSRKDNTEKKLSLSSNFTRINICYAIIIVGGVDRYDNNGTGSKK
jgi:hypothetical protein